MFASLWIGLLMLAALSQALEPSLAAIAAPSDAVLGVFLVAAGPIRFLAPSAFRALDFARYPLRGRPFFCGLIQL
jgi:hypothetical protein